MDDRPEGSVVEESRKMLRVRGEEGRHGGGSPDADGDGDGEDDRETAAGAGVRSRRWSRSKECQGQ